MLSLQVCQCSDYTYFGHVFVSFCLLGQSGPVHFSFTVLALAHLCRITSTSVLHTHTHHCTRICCNSALFRRSDVTVGMEIAIETMTSLDFRKFDWSTCRKPRMVRRDMAYGTTLVMHY